MTAVTNLSITSIAGLTNNPNQTIAGTGAVGTTVKVLDGTTLLDTTVVGSNGTWSEVVTLSGQGAHSISAQSDGSPVLTTLVNFDGSNGQAPVSGLVVGLTGTLFGTTSEGGTFGGGTVFELSGVDHKTLTTLVNFDGFGSTGREPYGDLIIDTVGNVYGTTIYGNRLLGDSNDFGGSVFQLSGVDHKTFTSLVNFDGANGSRPLSGLTFDRAGHLYGTTYCSGSYVAGDSVFGNGTVFELSGIDYKTLTTLTNFDGSTGVYLLSELVSDDLGNLYGMGLGPVFELSGADHKTLTKLAIFFDNTNFSPSYSGFTLDGAGNLYGVVMANSDDSKGAVFQLSGADHKTLTVLANFDGTNGSFPRGGLAFDNVGNLYGTTSSGGSNDLGTVFKLSGADHKTLTTLVNFDGMNGSGKGVYFGGLTYDGLGNIYGTTSVGGANDLGTVYKLSLNASQSSDSIVVDLDTEAPRVVYLSETSNNVHNNLAKAGDVITESFTSTDFVSSVLINGQAASVVHGEGDNYVATYTVQADSINGLSNSVIAAQDLAGNITTSNFMGSVVVDTVAPILSIPLPSFGGRISTATQILSGSGEPGTVVTIMDGIATLGTAVVGADGVWADTIVLTGQGSHTITATGADLAGNVGMATTWRTLLTGEPLLTIASNGGVVYQNAQTVLGTGLIGSTITLVESQFFAGVPRLLGTTTVDHNGNWMADITLTGAGDHSVSALSNNFGSNLVAPTSSSSIDYSLESLIGSVGANSVIEDVSISNASLVAHGLFEVANNTKVGFDGAFGRSSLWLSANYQTDLALQGDGKIVAFGAAGASANGNFISELVRFNTDGSIDEAFGNNLVDSMAGSSKFNSGKGGVAIQSDGKILVASGIVPWGDRPVPATITRINVDGSLDQTFGDGGVVAIARSVAGYSFTDVLQTASGDIDALGANGAVVKLSSEGVFLSAQSSSEATINFPSNQTLLALPSTVDIPAQIFTGYGVMGGLLSNGVQPSDFVIQSNGQIVVGGGTRVWSAAVHGSFTSRMELMRFNADGSQDLTFNNAPSSQEFSTSVISASNNLGNLVLASDGSYTYSVANSAVQYLNTHQTKVDTFTITSSDGTTKDVSFTISGTDEVVLVDPSNHAPTVSAPLTSTSAVRTQAFWSNLLTGASDADAGDHLSVTGLTYTVNGNAASAQPPSGIQLVNNQLLVDPNNTAFNNLTTGQSETIVASYTIADNHGGSVAQTNTIVIGSPAIDPIILNNHAPTVVAPLVTTFSKGSQAFWSNLLSGAADVDARNTLNVTDLRFSVAGAATTTVAPTGIQFANNQLLVDPNSTAFKDLTSGQTETIVASYNISDGYGGAVAQTNSLTVTGLGATSAGSNPNISPSLISVAAALQSTSTAGTQGFWSNLLAGATNSNPNAHLDVANLRFSVNSGASTVITPVGIQYANKSIMVDPNNTAFRALAAGQSDTIVASYNIVDGLGSSVAQTDTIIINGQGSQGDSSGGVNTPTPNNHTPEVSAPVTAQAGVHTSAFWSNMLAGATDSDVGNQLHVSNVLFSLNGGVAVSSAPKGIQVANDQLLVDPNSTAFNHLGVGQADTIVASYNVIDGHGGSVAQTDTVTISGPAATVANGIITGTANHDILTGTAGKDIIIVGPGADTLTGGKGADVFKYTSLLNSPTSSTAPTTTITDFSTTDGDRVDVTAILNGASTLNSTIHVNQTGASNTSLSVTVGGVEYYIANVPNQAVSVPDAVANPASGATLTTALHGADWTTVVDVASAHGAPATITAAGTATVTNAAANPAGDWTAVVQAGAATVDTAQSQVTFAAAPAANAVSIQTADTTVHEVSNVTAVVWHI